MKKIECFEDKKAPLSQLKKQFEEMKAFEIEVKECSNYPIDTDINPKRW